MNNIEIKEYDDWCNESKSKIIIDGPWNKEPNRLSWMAHGLDCMIIRNSDMLFLCGYVGVPSSHWAFNKGYNEMTDIFIHGGLTYANKCRGHICHVSDTNREIWWFGFDCAHSGDFYPTVLNYRDQTYEVYRDIEYVKAETEHLAEQLSRKV